MDNVIYREFWIEATESKLQEMTIDLQNDDRVHAFNKIDEESCCKTDKKNLVIWLQWMRDFIKMHADITDRKAEEMARRMLLLQQKLERMTK